MSSATTWPLASEKAMSQTARCSESCDRAPRPHRAFGEARRGSCGTRPCHRQRRAAEHVLGPEQRELQPAVERRRIACATPRPAQPTSACPRACPDALARDAVDRVGSPGSSGRGRARGRRRPRPRPRSSTGARRWRPAGATAPVRHLDRRAVVQHVARAAQLDADLRAPSRCVDLLGSSPRSGRRSGRSRRA